MNNFKLISYEKQGDAICLRFKNLRPSELEIQDAFQEIRKAIQDEKVNKAALSLGPNMECMYSVFLGKMISLQRQLNDLGGKLAVCHLDGFVVGSFFNPENFVIATLCSHEIPWSKENAGPEGTRIYFITVSPITT